MPPRKQKNPDITPKEELSKLEKQDLIARVMQLEAHVVQLKNIISKNISETSDKNDTKEKNRELDFSKCHFRRVLLHILYFGWDYNGYVVQEDTSQTVEHQLFQALIKCCLIQSRETSNYHRCGRTDKGVSAFGQVISISVRSKFPVSQQHSQHGIDNEMPYCKILNRLLPKDIRAVAWYPIPEDAPEFSARFNCNKRTYKYYFPRSSLDIQAMRAGCTRLVGSHDYRNLCKMDVGNGVVEFRRRILKADVLPIDYTDTELPTSMYYLQIEGNAFLWHQIRCIMGVLLLIGERKEAPEVISELLDVEKHPRKPQYNMALDVPLNLFHCSYELPGAGSWRYDTLQLAELLAHLQSDWTLLNIKTTMVKDVLNELESQYFKSCGSEIEDNKIVAYTDCLLQGFQSKSYTPLLKRATCSSLEERIQHRQKKLKVGDPDEEIK